MSSAWIRARAVKLSARNPRGKTYQVLYRRGGRAYKLETAGTFKTEKEARTRRDLVAGWLAQGLNPRDELAKLAMAEPAVKTLSQWAAAYKASRVDLSNASDRTLDAHLKRILDDTLAARNPQTITAADIQEWIARQSDLKPSSLSRYVTALRQILDYAGVDPNPARHKTVRLPASVKEEPNPPTADHFTRMLQAMPRRYLLPIITLEQTAMRVGEAASLTWGDVDEAGNRFRLRAGETKTRRARWVQVPDWLMAVIAATVPREDRTDTRAVFPGFTANVARSAMRKACVAAGIPHFHPHDLRHRRATIWHHDGVPTRVLMERGGWARSDIAIDTYSHLLPVDEVPVSALKRLAVMSP